MCNISGCTMNLLLEFSGIPTGGAALSALSSVTIRVHFYKN